MHVVILAAGKGNRLAHLTAETPKPLISILGKTILERIVASLPPVITDIIVITGYREEQIRSFCAGHARASAISCISQGEMTGTYGALKTAEVKLASPFLVINGDDVHSQKDLQHLIEHPRAFGVAQRKSHGYYAIENDAQGNFSGMHSQTPEEKENDVFIATGAYVLDTDFFELTPVLTRENEYGIPQTLRASKDIYPVSVVDMPDWVPINTPEDLKEAEKTIVSL
jgi:UDP-N-acetylglucosamine diphosphorylase / glucose-1-phosphate thymidylyltransferase / UDP-N-acetylgalactosamine diphosphorylase / glucosamine-1-phosphate N-acetyltransferase / galactosamine-1-phosphate N-acetyltransferase